MQRALLAALWLAAPAPCLAQFVTAPEAPQPRQPGDVIGLVLQNAGNARSPAKLITFGEVFERNRLNAGLQALIGNAAEPVQADVKSRYPDGSVRFAVLTMTTPKLRSGQKIPVMLRQAASPHPGNVNLRQALAAHDITVTLRLNATGADTGQTAQTLSFDAARMLDAAMRGHATSPWLSGPLASETRVSQRVAGSLRLVMDLRAYANGAIDADIQFNNDIAMQKRGGPASYAVAIAQDGHLAFAAPHVMQYQYQDWHTIIRSDGRSSINVVHDIAVMERAGAVPSYQLKYGVAPKALYQEAGQIRSPGWDTPLAVNALTQYEPMTGARPDIGPTTTANAIWLISQNPVAAVYAISQADTAGALPWHMFNLKTGNFITLADYPNLWTDPRGGPYSNTTGLTQKVNGKSGWTPDGPHEPDLSFIPFLMTGRRYYLDQLNAAASWDEVSFWPAPQARNQGQGIVVGSGNQVRGSAWSLRALDDAAYANPQGSMMQRYFAHLVANNLSYMIARLPRWTAREGQAYGYIPGDYGGGGNIAPWEQDFFATTIGLVALRAQADGSNADAVTITKWVSHFTEGRFLSAAQGFNPHDGISYNIWVYKPMLKTYDQTWAEIDRATIANKEGNGDGWSHSGGYYGQTAMAALASEINVTHSRQGWEAYEWVRHSGAPYTDLGTHTAEPAFWIVPLGHPPAHLASGAP